MLVWITEHVCISEHIIKIVQREVWNFAAYNFNLFNKSCFHIFTDPKFENRAAEITAERTHSIELLCNCISLSYLFNSILISHAKSSCKSRRSVQRLRCSIAVPIHSAWKRINIWVRVVKVPISQLSVDGGRCQRVTTSAKSQKSHDRLCTYISEWLVEFFFVVSVVNVSIIFAVIVVVVLV